MNPWQGPTDYNYSNVSGWNNMPPMQVPNAQLQVAGQYYPTVPACQPYTSITYNPSVPISQPYTYSQSACFPGGVIESYPAQLSQSMVPVPASLQFAPQQPYPPYQPQPCVQTVSAVPIAAGCSSPEGYSHEDYSDISGSSGSIHGSKHYRHRARSRSISRERWFGNSGRQRTRTRSPNKDRQWSCSPHRQRQYSRSPNSYRRRSRSPDRQRSLSRSPERSHRSRKTPHRWQQSISPSTERQLSSESQGDREKTRTKPPHQKAMESGHSSDIFKRLEEYKKKFNALKTDSKDSKQTVSKESSKDTETHISKPQALHRARSGQQGSSTSTSNDKTRHPNDGQTSPRESSRQSGTPGKSDLHRQTELKVAPSINKTSLQQPKGGSTIECRTTVNLSDAKDSTHSKPSREMVQTVNPARGNMSIGEFLDSDKKTPSNTKKDNVSKAISQIESVTTESEHSNGRNMKIPGIQTKPSQYPGFPNSNTQATLVKQSVDIAKQGPSTIQTIISTRDCHRQRKQVDVKSVKYGNLAASTNLRGLQKIGQNTNSTTACATKAEVMETKEQFMKRKQEEAQKKLTLEREKIALKRKAAAEKPGHAQQKKSKVSDVSDKNDKNLNEKESVKADSRGTVITTELAPKVAKIIPKVPLIKTRKQSPMKTDAIKDDQGNTTDFDNLCGQGDDLAKSKNMKRKLMNESVNKESNVEKCKKHEQNVNKESVDENCKKIESVKRESNDEKGKKLEEPICKETVDEQDKNLKEFSNKESNGDKGKNLNSTVVAKLEKVSECKVTGSTSTIEDGSCADDTKGVRISDKRNVCCKIDRSEITEVLKMVLDEDEMAKTDEGRMLKKEARVCLHPLSEVDKIIEKIDKDVPLLGLQYVTEIVDVDKAKHTYSCLLCKVRLDGNSLQSHIVGQKHTINYFTRNQPDVLKKLINRPKDAVNSILHQEGKRVMRQFGRQQVQCVLADEYERPKGKQWSVVMPDDDMVLKVDTVSQEMDNKSTVNKDTISITSGNCSGSNRDVTKTHPADSTGAVDKATEKSEQEEKTPLEITRKPLKEFKAGTEAVVVSKTFASIEDSGNIEQEVLPSLISSVESSTSRLEKAAETSLKQQVVALMTKAKSVSYQEGRQFVAFYKFIQNKPDVPLLGLDKILEVTGFQQGPPVQYVCSMCKTDLIAGTQVIFDHTQEAKHIEKYLRQSHPDKYSKVCGIHNSQQRRVALDNQARLAYMQDGKKNIKVARLEDLELADKGGPVDMPMKESSVNLKDISMATPPSMDKPVPASGAIEVGSCHGEPGSCHGEPRSCYEEPGITVRLFELLKGLDTIPLVGLNYITEIQGLGNKGHPRYQCRLCDTTHSMNFINAHITSHDHRCKFLKMNYPLLYSRTGGTKDLVLKYVTEIEDRYGRESIWVKTMLAASPSGMQDYTEPVLVKGPWHKEEAVKGNTDDAKQDSVEPLIQSPFKEKGANPDTEFAMLIEGLDYTPLLGLQFITEVQHPSRLLPAKYECLLCHHVGNGTPLTTSNILNHISARGHRLNFFRETHEHIYREIVSYKDRQEQNRVLLQHTKDIETAMGRGIISQVVAPDLSYWSDTQPEPSTPVSDQTSSADSNAHLVSTAAGSISTQEICLELKHPPPLTEMIPPLEILPKASPIVQDILLKKDGAFSWKAEFEKLQERLRDGRIIQTTGKSRFSVAFKSTFVGCAVLGIQWVVEVQRPNIRTEPYYLCRLCEEKIIFMKIQSHLTGLRHRIMYLGHCSPELYQSISQRKFTNLAGLRTKIDSIAEEIAKNETDNQGPEVLMELDTSILTDSQYEPMPIQTGPQVVSQTKTSCESPTMGTVVQQAVTSLSSHNSGMPSEASMGILRPSVYQGATAYGVCAEDSASIPDQHSAATSQPHVSGANPSPPSGQCDLKASSCSLSPSVTFSKQTSSSTTGVVYTSDGKVLTKQAFLPNRAEQNESQLHVDSRDNSHGEHHKSLSWSSSHSKQIDRFPGLFPETSVSNTRRIANSQTTNTSVKCPQNKINAFTHNENANVADSMYVAISDEEDFSDMDDSVQQPDIPDEGFGFNKPLSDKELKTIEEAYMKKLQDDDDFLSDISAEENDEFATAVTETTSKDNVSLSSNVFELASNYKEQPRSAGQIPGLTMIDQEEEKEQNDSYKDVQLESSALLSNIATKPVTEDAEKNEKMFQKTPGKETVEREDSAKTSVVCIFANAENDAKTKQSAKTANKAMIVSNESISDKSTCSSKTKNLESSTEADAKTMSTMMEVTFSLDRPINNVQSEKNKHGKQTKPKSSISKLSVNRKTQKQSANRSIQHDRQQSEVQQSYLKVSTDEKLKKQPVVLLQRLNEPCINTSTGSVRKLDATNAEEPNISKLVTENLEVENTPSSNTEKTDVQRRALNIHQKEEESHEQFEEFEVFLAELGDEFVTLDEIKEEGETNHDITKIEISIGETVNKDTYNKQIASLSASSNTVDQCSINENKEMKDLSVRDESHTVSASSEKRVYQSDIVHEVGHQKNLLSFPLEQSISASTQICTQIPASMYRTQTCKTKSGVSKNIQSISRKSEGSKTTAKQEKEDARMQVTLQTTHEMVTEKVQPILEASYVDSDSGNYMQVNKTCGTGNVSAVMGGGKHMQDDSTEEDNKKCSVQLATQAVEGSMSNQMNEVVSKETDHNLPSVNCDTNIETKTDKSSDSIDYDIEDLSDFVCIDEIDNEESVIIENDLENTEPTTVDVVITDTEFKTNDGVTDNYDDGDEFHRHNMEETETYESKIGTEIKIEAHVIEDDNCDEEGAINQLFSIIDETYEDDEEDTSELIGLNENFKIMDEYEETSGSNTEYVKKSSSPTSMKEEPPVHIKDCTKSTVGSEHDAGAEAAVQTSACQALTIKACSITTESRHLVTGSQAPEPPAKKSKHHSDVLKGAGTVSSRFKVSKEAGGDTKAKCNKTPHGSKVETELQKTAKQNENPMAEKSSGKVTVGSSNAASSKAKSPAGGEQLGGKEKVTDSDKVKTQTSSKIQSQETATGKDGKTISKPGSATNCATGTRSIDRNRKEPPARQPQVTMSVELNEKHNNSYTTKANKEENFQTISKSSGKVMVEITTKEAAIGKKGDNKEGRGGNNSEGPVKKGGKIKTSRNEDKGSSVGSGKRRTDPSRGTNSKESKADSKIRDLHGERSHGHDESKTEKKHESLGDKDGGQAQLHRHVFYSRSGRDYEHRSYARSQGYQTSRDSHSYFRSRTSYRHRSRSRSPEIQCQVSVEFS